MTLNEYKRIINQDMNQFSRTKYYKGIREHHYVLDAASLVDVCRHRITQIVRFRGDLPHPGLLTLDSTLKSCEDLIQEYLNMLLSKEQRIMAEWNEKIDKVECIDNDASVDFDLSITCGSSMSMLMKTAIKLKIITQKKNRYLRIGLNSNQNASKENPSTIRSNLAEDNFLSGLSPKSLKKKEKKNLENDLKKLENNTKSKTWKFENTTKHKYSKIKRGPDDSLLFNLVLILQLCCVRLEDADSNMCGANIAKYRSQYLSYKMASSFINSSLEWDEYQNMTRKRKNSDLESIYEDSAGLSHFDEEVFREDRFQKGFGRNLLPFSIHKEQTLWSSLSRNNKFVCIGTIGLGTLFLTKGKQKDKNENTNKVRSALKLILTACSVTIIRRRWMLLTMNARLSNSSVAIDLWQQKWVVHQSLYLREDKKLYEQRNYDIEDRRKAEPSAENHSSIGMTQASAQRLLESIPLESSESSFWQSQGALRFLLLKRAMDLFYASVGTAIQVTGSEANSGVWMPVAAAAASYYAITGPDATANRVAQLMSSSSSVLIKRAWGMVSLPAVKRVSLEVSKLLKGAAIAKRISIAGVSCFIISKESYLPLSTGLKRFHRQQQRKVSNLSTILESPNESCATYPRQTTRKEEYPKKDIILHMTGGGFFAHTIAGDLPYLIDWSGYTNAVVICPEYALLPEYTYPTALNQIADIYCSLVGGDASSLLGFQPNRIIVTGESAGGNLAAALCVKLCMDDIVGTSDIKSSTKRKYDGHDINIRLPDAIMLCCPTLNLSLSMPHSRIIRDSDPVLPSGLISAISDAYLPPDKKISKDDPLASPYFAPDSILRFFPPTLLYATSADPLLDDSVHFNARLKRLGVDSDLRAVHHLPHAYWGLGTAGFPEAQVVQTECQNWLVRQFNIEPSELR